LLTTSGSTDKRAALPSGKCRPSINHEQDGCPVVGSDGLEPSIDSMGMLCRGALVEGAVAGAWTLRIPLSQTSSRSAPDGLAAGAMILGKALCPELWFFAVIGRGGHRC